MTSRSIESVISDRRRHLGMTQMELADLLGVRQRDVARWEHGRAQLPAIPQLERLSQVLGLPVGDLVPGGREPEIRLILLSPCETDQVFRIAREPASLPGAEHSESLLRLRDAIDRTAATRKRTEDLLERLRTPELVAAR
jgi:transcriptional regulator with XRE-family HTH domain